MVSATRSVTVVNTPVTTAVVHYNRPAGDYADWGLHLFGDAVASTPAWDAPKQRDGIDTTYGAFYNISLQDDTQPVKFIMHRPSGDSVPTTREPGGDRSSSRSSTRRSGSSRATRPSTSPPPPP